jgi:hypothetical protein
VTPGVVDARCDEGKHTDSTTGKSVVHMRRIHRTDTSGIGQPDTRHIEDGFPTFSARP